MLNQELREVGLHGLDANPRTRWSNIRIQTDVRPQSHITTWGRIHVDFLSPFSFVRTFLRFTSTFVSYFPRSVCEVKKTGIHVDILTKIWYSRRVRKNFLKNFVQASLGTPILRDADINDIFFFTLFSLIFLWYSMNGIFLLLSQSIWF